MREGLAARLRAAFLDDLDEQLRAANAELLALEAAPADPAPLRALFRVAHTLKGAARAAALPGVEGLCHAVEELLSEARDGRLALEPGHFALLFGAADLLAATGERMRAGEEPDDDALATLAGAVRAADLHDLPGLSPDSGSGGSQSAGSGAESTSAPPPVTLDLADSVDAAPSPPITSSSAQGTTAPPASDATTSPPPAPAPPAATTPPIASPPIAQPPAASAPAASPSHAERGDGRVRVEAEKLDALLASVEQLLLARARLDARLPEVEALRDRAARAAEVAKRGSADTEEDAPAALAREAGRVADALRKESRALGQVADELADRVRRTRMRPFTEAAEALPRAVRDVAAASGKEARLAVTGGDVEADRPVIDAFREALLHLVRNAVDHGIEAPDARAAAGKPRAGTVAVAAALRGEQVVVTVADDGRGLDAEGVREGLRRRGRAVPEDDRALAGALFEGGFSTRDEATEISGRGVGLDAARAALARVRGTVRVDWTAGRGTTFTLECPLTLATIRALLVRVSGQVVAVPTPFVEILARAVPGDLRRAGDREVLLGGDGPVPVVPLARVLGPPLEEAAVAGVFEVVRLRAGGRRLAVVVDEAVDERELVVRPLPRGRREIPHFGGAALLGSGEVALVLDAPAVVAAGLAAGAAPLRVTEAPEAKAARHRILVVDDSITTRTLEESTLEAAGYEVMTAVDGEDGWRLLQERGADLVVTDVEMPRMDGISLAQAIRASKRFAALPVIIVSSLENAEHRARGMEAGADAYVGKSSFDQTGLLETIRRLLG